VAAIDALRKRWREEARFRSFRPYLYIDDEGLSLGAGTLLAPMAQDREGLPALALDGEETRILATLSLGFRQPISIAALKFIRRASMQWGRDEKALAHFELAYARLPRFETRDDAESLFLADGFVRLGLSPCALMLAHGLDTSQLDLLKFIPHFNPAEPRVPAGHGRESGQWTQGDSTTTADDQSATDAGTYIHPVVEDEGPEEREKEKELLEAERRALRVPSTKEDVEEGHGIRIQTPLIEQSDPIGIGPHAGESIPARSPARNFTVQERQEINRIGEETGCHTCGTKEPGTASGNFIPDHQPPSSLNILNDPQRLYPHCLTCSNKQGSAIMRLRKGETR
jgi:hypothetical protein